jgi:hypothetical protein
MGERDLLLAQPRLVGEEDGEGENDKLGTGICIEGEKHCFPGTVDLVGEGLGDGDVLGEGKGPTPMVRGVMGSVLLEVCPWLGAFFASLVSLKLRSSQLWLRLFSIHRPLCISLSVWISCLPTSPVSSTFSLFSLDQPAPCPRWAGRELEVPGLTGLKEVEVLHLLHLLAGWILAGLSLAAAVWRIELLAASAATSWFIRGADEDLFSPFFIASSTSVSASRSALSTSWQLESTSILSTILTHAI